MAQRWWTYDRFSSPQRTAGVGLVLFQSAALGWLMEAPVFAVCAAAIALAGWLAPQNQLIRNFNRTYAYSFTALLFGLKYLFSPSEFEFDRTFVNSPLAYEIACYCIVIELQALFMKEYVPKLPLWFLGISVVGMIFTADIRIKGFQRTWMLLCMVGFSICWMAFAAASRSRVNPREARRFGFRERVMAGVAGVAVLTGLFLSVLMHRHESELEEALTAYLALGHPVSARSGFSGRGGLADVSAWKTVNSNVIALEVDSAEPPGYLRGRVFDLFEHDRWEVSEVMRPLSPVPAEMAARLPRLARYSYLVQAPVPESLRAMTVWPVEAETGNRLFLPLETVVVACETPSVFVDDGLSVSRNDLDAVQRYAGLVAAEVPQPTGQGDHSLYLELPDHLHSEVFRVAADVFADAVTDTQKIDAVQDFFRQNFKYHLGVQIPHRADRLSYFLTERPAAHCEYFATAATILLRLAGVPARYVTGFVVEEQNPISGHWVARRKDAHAWVEAFDSGRNRWVTVESTPSAGVPSASATNMSTLFLEATASLWRRLKEAVRRIDVWQLLTSLFLLVAAVAISGLMVSALRQGWRAMQQRKRSTFRLDEQLTQLTRERRKMDQFLAKRGVRRPEEETVLQFARRIETVENIPQATGIADWYRQYLAIRFSGLRAGPEEVRKLEEERRTLVMSRRQQHV